MKTYFSDVIPRVQKFSQKLDNLTLLMKQHWVFIEDIERTKTVYIFRQNNELLISQNGIVERARWEYLGHNSLIIDRNYIEPEARRNVNTVAEPQNLLKAENDIAYIAPGYRITSKEEEASFFGDITEKLMVEFDDEARGEIFVKRKNGQAYFKAKPEGFWLTMNYIYSDKDQCIAALHCFLTTKKVILAGLIGKN